MFHPAPPTDQLEQIHALNRLFLTLLQRRTQSGCECFGLPPPAVAALRGASSRELDCAAEFPRALFRIELRHGATARDARRPSEQPQVETYVAVSLTILLSAWNLSRQSDYHARLFLGLEPQAVRALRATPLSDLPTLARAPELLRCAFADCARLWEALLRRGVGRRRELTLIGLQPQLSGNASWPAHSGASRYLSPALHSTQ